MTHFLITLLKIPLYIWQYGFSPFFPPCCRYHPTCSHYGLKVLNTHGLKGIPLLLKRLLTCHPFLPQETTLYDPPPDG